MIQNARQLKAHDGEFFHDWRMAVIRSMGAVLPDASPPNDERGAPHADRT